ncbi:hypothetical protein [Paraburkholderia youngii]|uniref:hypothetical protein n=1 Tax=Paraburkholderia youngii TaxID=2782701 RepID=UPI003D1B1BDE
MNTRNTFTGAHVNSYEVGGLDKFAVDFFLYANYIYAKGNEDLSGILWVRHIMRGKSHGYADEEETYGRSSGGGPRAAT